MKMIRYSFCIMLVLLLISCGGGHKTENHLVIENPYIQRVNDMTHLGVVAMQKERWGSAENAFKHALQAATLVNDPQLIVRAWYNISMVHKAMWLQRKFKLEQVENDLRHVMDLAQKYSMQNEAIGAQLQLSLLNIKGGKEIEPSMSELPAGLSTGVYLIAARLAQLQHHDVEADTLYRKVLHIAKHTRSGLRLKAQAYTGLGLLAERLHHNKDAQQYAMQALLICTHIGAPRISANASLLLARLNHIPIQERANYANRAFDIYQVLHDKHGEERAKALLGALKHG
jgi:hypothetical protein